MPGRETPLVKNEIYHVYNRAIASQPIFTSLRDCKRVLDTFFYYQNKILPCRYAFFIVQSQDTRDKTLKKLRKLKNFFAEIIAFCFMPNHFHFLLRQKTGNGISDFLSKFTNSYTRYFNTKTKRFGPLFGGKFKAKRIETQEQLIHVSRYIHLNPLTSFLVKSEKDLVKYPFSSLPEYINSSEEIIFCHKMPVLDSFKSKFNYKKFVFDQAEYQRKLHQIKHLIFE